jgi:ArsR family transcriptional regulator
MKTDFNIADMEANAAEASAFLKALASPIRLLVLCNLIDGEQSSGELAERLGISHPNLSQHLAKLRAEGFVDTRRTATTITYRIAEPKVKAIILTMHEMFCAEGDAPVLELSQKQES